MFRGDVIIEKPVGKFYLLHDGPELAIYQQYRSMKKFYVMKGELAENFRVKKALKEAVNSPHVDLADMPF